MSFVDNIKETLNEDFNESITENGAVGYRTSGKALLDINFNISSMRNMNEDQIIDKFVKAFYEDKRLAMKWLFYAGDVRGGVGERRLFRILLKYLAQNHLNLAKAVIELVPEYTRWDNLWCLLDTELVDYVINLVEKQLNKDIANMNDNHPISLLAKWLPSIVASSKKTKRYGCIICEKLGISEKTYRTTISKLRKYLRVTETYMSSNRWNEIDYSVVPSRANLIYKDAFLKHDEERRKEYLNSLSRGEMKINSGVLFPHNIVCRYRNESGWGRNTYEKEDIALEELWKALPDYVNGNGNTICVADGSGSMTSTVGNSNVTCLDVANALAVYFSERCEGQFKNNYITFSEHPQLVDFNKAKTLREKLEIASHYNEVANTNIEAVFDLILQTALNNHMSQSEMPKNILILSDMEFDKCVTSGESNNRWQVNRPEKKLFKIFEERYARHGYKLPRLVFWNICSRTGAIPVRENDLGVALVSGFSPVIAKMVLSNKTDPLECLIEQLDSDRYDMVENAIKDLVA